MLAASDARASRWARARTPTCAAACERGRPDVPVPLLDGADAHLVPEHRGQPADEAQGSEFERHPPLLPELAGRSSPRAATSRSRRGPWWMSASVGYELERRQPQPRPLPRQRCCDERGARQTTRAGTRTPAATTTTAGTMTRRPSPSPSPRTTRSSGIIYDSDIELNAPSFVFTTADGAACCSRPVTDQLRVHRRAEHHDARDRPLHRPGPHRRRGLHHEPAAPRRERPPSAPSTRARATSCAPSTRRASRARAACTPRGPERWSRKAAAWPGCASTGAEAWLPALAGVGAAARGAAAGGGALVSASLPLLLAVLASWRPPRGRRRSTGAPWCPAGRCA